MTRKFGQNLPSSSVVVPPISFLPNAILDSGATGTFVAHTHILFLQHTTTVTNGPTVLLASGSAMRSQLQGTLPLSAMLSSKAQSAYVLDELQTGTLISLGQLCDDDCIAIFNKYKVRFTKENKVIITGKRMTNGLWSIPIKHADPTVLQANGILRLDKPRQDLAAYHHAALGSPATSTLLRAI